MYVCMYVCMYVTQNEHFSNHVGNFKWEKELSWKKSLHSFPSVSGLCAQVNMQYLWIAKKTKVGYDVNFFMFCYEKVWFRWYCVFCDLTDRAVIMVIIILPSHDGYIGWMAKTSTVICAYYLVGMLLFETKQSIKSWYFLLYKPQNWITLSLEANYKY